jgi:acetylornithine deacetylase/succinyl-diaminopimelate desuccinylase-like protein
MPDETVAGTKAAIEKAVSDPQIKVSVMGDVVQAPESPPTPQLLGSVEKVVHAMWPGKPIIPAMAAGASDSIFTLNAGIPSYGVGGAWEDIDDVRAHGRDERVLVKSFYHGQEYLYRLVKRLAGGG